MSRTRLFHSVVVVGSGLLAGCGAKTATSGTSPASAPPAVASDAGAGTTDAGAARDEPPKADLPAAPPQPDYC